MVLWWRAGLCACFFDLARWVENHIYALSASQSGVDTSGPPVPFHPLVAGSGGQDIPLVEKWKWKLLIKY